MDIICRLQNDYQTDGFLRIGTSNYDYVSSFNAVKGE